MTSAKLFSKLLRENRKQKMGIRLLSDVLFFIFTLSFFMREVFLSQDKMLFGIRNWNMMGITIFLAVITGMQGYGYFLKTKSSDFYFSLPIKRSHLFLVNDINGILLYVVPMIISQSVCFLMVKTIGEVSDSSLSVYFFAGMGIHFLAYLFFYHLTILAILLSGTGIMALALLSIFCFWTRFFLDEVILPLCTLFFRTFYKIESIELLKQYFSPLHLYEKMNGMEESSPLFPYLYEADTFGLGVLLLGNLFLFCLCFYLQKKRSAEAAGTALAFGKMEKFVHIIIDVPVGMLLGRIVMTVTTIANPSVRIIVGMLGGIVGGIFCYGLLEVLLQMKLQNLHRFREIYQFHKSSTKRKQMLLEGGLTVGLLAVFFVGASSYNQYLPKEETVEAIGISIDGVDKKGTVDYTERRLQDVKLTGTEQQQTYEWLKERSVFTKEKPLTKVTAAYYLKNGNTVYRTYPIYEREEIEAFDAVYTTKQYKSGIYEAFSYTDYEDMEIVWTNEIERVTLDLEEQEIEQFLQVYLEELTELSIQTVEQEFPIGRIQIQNEEFQRETDGYLYPSFEKTIATLEQKGIPVKKMPSEYDIAKVEVTSYENYGEEKESHTFRKAHEVYTEKEEIQKAVKNVVCQEYAMQPILHPVDRQQEIEIRFQNADRGTAYRVQYYRP